MKNRLKNFVAAVTVTLIAACTPHKIIPDEELALIFHDAFLANAYITTQSVDKDSLNIYEPIFARYGYTTEDVQYTIGNFSKRKSARLGDVVELAIEQLKTEEDIYEREVAALDTIDNVARRTFSHIIVSDTLFHVKSLRDTAKLAYAIDVVPGDYNVSLKYEIDSLDKNEAGLRCRMWLDCADSTRAKIYTTTLRRLKEYSITQNFVVDTTHRRLRLQLMEFGDKKPQKPSITIRDLEIKYTTPTAEAVDSLYDLQLNVRLFADEFFSAARLETPQTDSIPQTLE